MKHISPLRYPGGKANLVPFLTSTIDLNGLRGCVYFEPYVGGGGAALGLLRDGVVSEIYLNDADERIFAFWDSALQHTEKFVERIKSVPLTIEEWHRQNEISSSPTGHSRFDVGFAAFFMNRCNRSGVLSGAGPIGGYEQKSNWQMDVRFGRETLIERIIFLGRNREKIKFFHRDAIEFLKFSLPRGRGRNRVFVYLDPPYVVKGKRLYLNAYEENDHKALSEYLNLQKSLPWIVSYDDTELVRRLYLSQNISTMPIHYTLQNKRKTHELIIAPHHISLPSICINRGQQILFQEIQEVSL